MNFFKYFIKYKILYKSNTSVKKYNNKLNLNLNYTIK